MNEAIYCSRCGKTYLDHDGKSCPNPDWKDVGDDTSSAQLKFSDYNRAYAMIPATASNTIVFYNEGKECGKLILKKDTLDFEGNTSESAKVFIALVKQLWKSLPEEQKHC